MVAQPPVQARSAGVGGGGKIRTNGRRWRFNPYDRPPPAVPSPQKSPKWLSEVLVPASRKIASGAAKILSSVFIPDSSSSDSSASSASDEGSISEGDVNCDNSRYDGHPDQTNGSNLAEILPQGCTSKELGVGVKEPGRKHVIVQLLLQETFSREEYDELVKIINSRVLEHSFVDRGKIVDSAPIPGSSVLNVTPDYAVMEARKFLEEKKARQSPQSGFGGLYSAMIQDIESAAGSPADMAKSYMQARPPWASPSTEEKLHSVSPLKERNVLALGAWSMHDEIRRVRSKATEDMLSPLSSSKVEIRRSQDNGVTVAIPGEWRRSKYTEFICRN